ncbi:MAG TPA: hypothetical protein VGJ39_05595 [Vicinamibacterales bacterium]
MRHLWWVLLLIASAMAPAAAAAEKRVVIRTYQSGLVSSGDLSSALSVAADILKTAGLEPQWRICAEEPEQPGSDACAEPLGPNELAIRFLRRPLSPNSAGHVPLGSSLIDTRAGSGSLATIYVDRVTGFARDSGTQAGVLLGRAIAHEIGHLLLGTTSHTRTGLMRAVWSTRALQRNRAGDWLFTPNDARSMRDGLFPDAPPHREGARGR